MRYSGGANKLSGWRVLKERVWGDEATGERQSCRKQRPHHHPSATDTLAEEAATCRITRHSPSLVDACDDRSS